MQCTEEEKKGSAVRALTRSKSVEFEMAQNIKSLIIQIYNPEPYDTVWYGFDKPFLAWDGFIWFHSKKEDQNRKLSLL